MSTIDRMNFLIQPRYKQELNSDEIFSKNLYGVITPSVIQGFSVQHSGSGAVTINSGICWVGDNTGQEMIFWVNARESTLLPVLNSGRYLVMTFQYIKSEENYPEFIITDIPKDSELVLAELFFDDTDSLIGVSTNAQPQYKYEDDFQFEMTSTSELTVSKGVAMLNGKIASFDGGTIALPESMTNNLLIYLYFDDNDKLQLAYSETIPNTTIPVPNYAMEINADFVPICQFNNYDTPDGTKPRASNLKDRRIALTGISTSNAISIPSDIQDSFQVLDGSNVSTVLQDVDLMVSNIESTQNINVTNCNIARINDTTVRVASGTITYPLVFRDPLNNVRFKMVNFNVNSTVLDVVEDSSSQGFWYKVIFREGAFEVIDMENDQTVYGDEVIICLIAKFDTALIITSVRALNELWLSGYGCMIANMKGVPSPTVAIEEISLLPNPLNNKLVDSSYSTTALSTNKYVYLNPTNYDDTTTWDYTFTNEIDDVRASYIYFEVVSVINTIPIFYKRSMSMDDVNTFLVSAVDNDTMRPTKAPPIGSPYYQIVGYHLEPHLRYPNTIWEKLYDGESVTVSTDGVLAQENRLSDGIQEDTMQRLTGTVIEPRKQDYSWFPDGSFYTTRKQQNCYSLEFYTPSNGYGVAFDNARQARTSTVNKMRNVPWNMWIRRA